MFSLKVKCLVVSESDIGLVFFVIVCFSAFALLMQVLFIAPVYRSRKPQAADANFVESSSSTQKLEVSERNGENRDKTLELRKARLDNIVKRPTRSGSKVKVSEALPS